MAQTFKFAVSASPATTPVVAQSRTSRIIVSEDPSVVSYPTTDFFVRKPLSGSPAIQRLAGSSYVFDTSGYFGAGQIVGYVSGVTGSTTFQQDEQGF